jgi:hypothetical protein
MVEYDFASGYMMGEFVSVMAGIGVGAAIVGMCWSVSNSRVDLALDQHRKESETIAENARNESETELLDQAIEMVRRNKG